MFSSEAEKLHHIPKCRGKKKVKVKGQRVN